jgi:hypothetical protein
LAAAADALREIKPPFSPESAIGEFAQLLKTYSVSKVVGDKYAGEWAVSQVCHRVRGGSEAEVRSVSRPVAAHQFASG